MAARTANPRGHLLLGSPDYRGPWAGVAVGEGDQRRHDHELKQQESGNGSRENYQ